MSESPALRDDVWIIVPLFNEGSVISDVVRDLLGTFRHVVCIDDGSTDDSAIQARRAGAVVIQHPVNLGQGAALQTGFEYALRQPAMQWVVTFDADGQHQVDDVLRMLERGIRDDLAVVFGSRFLDERTRAGFLRQVILKAAVAYTNLSTGTRLTDAHNGLRVLRRTVVERIYISQNRMAHASELVAQVGSLKIDDEPVRYGEEPVHILYTDYSRGKGQSLLNSVNILAELIFR